MRSYDATETDETDETLSDQCLECAVCREHVRTETPGTMRGMAASEDLGECFIGSELQVVTSPGSQYTYSTALTDRHVRDTSLSWRFGENLLSYGLRSEIHVW